MTSKTKCIRTSLITTLWLTCLFAGNCIAQQNGTGSPSTTAKPATGDAKNSKSGNTKNTDTDNNGNNAKPITSTTKFPVINVNLDMNTFSDYLPFDVAFMIAGGGPGDKITVDDLIRADLYYTPRVVKDTPCDCDLNDTTKWKHIAWVNNHVSNLYSFRIPPLPPNKHYTFFVKYQRVLTPDEQKKMVALVLSMIKPLLLSLSGKNDHELTNNQVDTVVHAIEKAMNLQLGQDGLGSSFKIPDQKSQEAMSKAANLMSFAFRFTENDQIELDTAVDKLKAFDLHLTKLRDNYRKPPQTDAKKKILDALHAAHEAIFKLYKPPHEQELDSAILVKTYKDNAVAVSVALDKVTLPNDAAFVKLADSIREISESVSYLLDTYQASYKNEKDIVGKNATPFTKVASASLFNSLSLGGSSLNYNFVTRSNSYVSADAGIAILPGIAKLTPYIGTNIYFRPINFDAPLSWRGSDFLAKRVSLVIGVSVASLARANVRSDLLGSSFNLVTGIGFRIVDWVHLGGGYIWYAKNAANPLNTNQSIAGTPYVSLTFDLRIKTALNSLFSSSQLSSLAP